MNTRIKSITESSQWFAILCAAAKRLTVAALLCGVLTGTLLAQDVPKQQATPQDSRSETPLSKGVLPMTPSTSQTDFTITDDELVFTSPGFPDYLRAIRLTDNLGYLSIFSTDLSGSPGAAIHMAGNGTSLPGQLYFDSGAHNAAALIFRTAPTGGIIEERLRITSSGNVGIGTASPGSKLTVNGVIESTGGGVRYPDGSVQATATLQGAPGPQGSAGAAGPQGPQGPAGAVSLPFTGSVSAASTVMNVTNLGTGAAFDARTSSTLAGQFAIQGLISSTTPGAGSAAVRGQNNGTGALGIGVVGTHAGGGWGVFGTTVTGDGVRGFVTSSSIGAAGVRGIGSGESTGVVGESTGGFGVVGRSTNINAVLGRSTNGTGVFGVSTNGDGVIGQTSSTTFGFAGIFSGRVQVNGTLSKTAGSFKIDHPLDPANKYLSHSFVESPDMMNIYNGVATLDEQGQAVIHLPDWFQALNRDFRYQLTAIGAPAPNLYIAEKVANNRFKIAGGVAGMEVSWQVTGIRQDHFANKHRIPVEEDKSEKERGHYLHPELFNAPEEKGVEWARKPELMKRLKEEREKHIKEMQEKLKETPQP